MLTNFQPAHPPQGCISDLAFDEWAAGELTPEQVGALETHVASCTRCATRKSELERSAATFLRRFPQLSATEHQAATPIKRGRGWLWGAASVVTAAAAALLLVRSTLNVAYVQPGDTRAGERTKGGAHLAFFVKRGARVFEGASGERLQAGDQLRFVISTPRSAYLAILSVDSRGTASVYYVANSARRFGPTRDEALDSSVELDDTAGRERIYGVFCGAPIDAEALRRDLAKTGELHAPNDCVTDVLEIVKASE